MPGLPRAVYLEQQVSDGVNYSESADVQRVLTTKFTLKPPTTTRIFQSGSKSLN